MCRRILVLRATLVLLLTQVPISLTSRRRANLQAIMRQKALQLLLCLLASFILWLGLVLVGGRLFVRCVGPTGD